jgi:hypothetical protein
MSFLAVTPWALMGTAIAWTFLATALALYPRVGLLEAALMAPPIGLSVSAWLVMLVKSLPIVGPGIPYGVIVAVTVLQGAAAYALYPRAKALLANHRRRLRDEYALNRPALIMLALMAVWWAYNNDIHYLKRRGNDHIAGGSVYAGEQSSRRCGATQAQSASLPAANLGEPGCVLRALVVRQRTLGAHRHSTHNLRAPAHSSLRPSLRCCADLPFHTNIVTSFLNGANENATIFSSLMSCFYAVSGQRAGDRAAVAQRAGLCTSARAHFHRPACTILSSFPAPCPNTAGRHAGVPVHARLLHLRAGGGRV